MRHTRLISIRACVAVLCVLLVQGCVDEVGETVEREAAADFTLKLFDGGNFRLSDHKGTPVVINFYASWCLSCGIGVFNLEKVYKEYADKKVLFIGVAVQDTEEKAKKYLAKHGITFPSGLDEDEAIKHAYGVVGHPFTFFVDRKGLIAYVHPGAITEELLKYELEKIL
ncbi:MAG: TlpA family protein disulfide reductase [Rhodospirillaceae bacterium]|nr:TlpA family protein disulfide reductase [Rhodospirillaceae bacterium]